MQNMDDIVQNAGRRLLEIVHQQKDNPEEGEGSFKG